MHLVYYAHSYRKPDDELNEMFEELMVSEGMTPSIDPPSDRLNSAKPERHLRSTDGLLCVLPYREGGPSSYILYEIELAMRGRRPVLRLCGGCSALECDSECGDGNTLFAAEFPAAGS